MSYKTWPAILHTLLISLVLFPNLALFAKSAMAQKPSEAQREDALYVCLKKKFPETRRSLDDHTQAFDPQSGRNFAWDKDKQVWIDTKTLEGICNTPAQVEDALYVCLKKKFPETRRSLNDHTRAFDPQSGRNFAWDKDKQAWIDTKTGECICPTCPASQAKKEEVRKEDTKTAGVPKTAFRLSDPIRMPIPESSGAGEVATGIAKGVVGGLLGGLFGGGGQESDEPSLPERPPYPEQTFTSKDGKTKVNISGAADPDAAQFTVGVQQSPGNGAPHLVVLQNNKGNILQPSDITVYEIWEVWGGWKVTVSWTKSYFEDGRLVKQEHGGWSTSWTEFLGRYKSPAEIPAIWRDFGGKPFEAIRGIIADFKFPEGQSFNPADWNLVAHVTTKEGNMIVTQPFIMDMKAGEKGVLSFTQRETTFWDAMTP